MNWRRYVREHLPPLNVSAEREIEIVDELAVQLETTFDRARANGATEDEAMQRARAEVPDWNALANTLGRIERPFTPSLAAGAGSGGLMTGLIQDLRYAVRALKRAPGFAAVSIVTLALGIAATTIVYSIVDGILLRPLPIQDPDRVMLARETINGQDMSVSWPNFLDWQKRQTSFASFAAWRGLTANLTGIEQPRRLNVRHVTWPLFSTLGVRADARPRLHARRRPRRRPANRARQLRVLAARAWRHAGRARPADHARRSAGHGDRRAAARLHDRPPGRHLPAGRHLSRRPGAADVQRPRQPLRLRRASAA